MQKELLLAPRSTCGAYCCKIARYSLYLGHLHVYQARVKSRHLCRCMSAGRTSDTPIPAAPRDKSQCQTDAPAAAEDLVQYIVLRKDLWNSLNWPLGSIVAQACHASTAALWLSKGSDATTTYCAPDKLDHMHKVSATCFSNDTCFCLFTAHWV